MLKPACSTGCPLLAGGQGWGHWEEHFEITEGSWLSSFSGALTLEVDRQTGILVSAIHLTGCVNLGKLLSLLEPLFLNL